MTNIEGRATMRGARPATMDRGFLVTISTRVPDGTPQATAEDGSRVRRRARTYWPRRVTLLRL